jgi:hypothetical protein
MYFGMRSIHPKKYTDMKMSVPRSYEILHAGPRPYHQALRFFWKGLRHDCAITGDKNPLWSEKV